MPDLERWLGDLALRSPNPLYQQALTHSSAGPENYERLEFLGDAVLKLSISRYLYERCPHMNEGQMTQVRARVVSDRCLAQAAEKLELGKFLHLGSAERRTHGEKKVGTIASALEALFAAAYLEEGFSIANRLILGLLEEDLEQAIKAPGSENSKALLQEWTQARNGTLPEYRLVGEEGPVHARIFSVEVWLGAEKLGEGEGRSKKAAEQAAALKALETLNSLTPKEAE